MQLVLLNVSNNKLKFLPESIGSCCSLEELQANGTFILSSWFLWFFLSLLFLWSPGCRSFVCISNWTLATLTCEMTSLCGILFWGDIQYHFSTFLRFTVGTFTDFNAFIEVMSSVSPKAHDWKFLLQITPLKSFLVQFAISFS